MSQAASVASGELILIVEDNDKNRKLFRDVLQYHGFRTLEASTSAEGIALALSHRPRVILMDIQLPDTDGIESLKYLRTQPDAFSGAIVALTAYAMKDDSERFLKAGFDGYISKPIDILEFPKQVRGFCRTTSSERPIIG
jgi:two-component system cell cycle response regulator DivK